MLPAKQQEGLVSARRPLPAPRQPQTDVFDHDEVLPEPCRDRGCRELETGHAGSLDGHALRIRQPIAFTLDQGDDAGGCGPPQAIELDYEPPIKVASAGAGSSSVRVTASLRTAHMKR